LSPRQQLRQLLPRLGNASCQVPTIDDQALEAKETAQPDGQVDVWKFVGDINGYSVNDGFLISLRLVRNAGTYCRAFANLDAAADYWRQIKVQGFSGRFGVLQRFRGE